MKKIFSFRLYVEGLKRVRLLGFAAGIVITLLMCIYPIVVLFDCPNADFDVMRPYRIALPLLLLLVAVPLLLFNMFAFLNKRNSSDFYHSIPSKRTCVMISFLAAGYTWIYGILLVSVGCSIGLWLFAGANIELKLIFVTLGMFAMLSLFIGGFVLLAKTLTGTNFSGGILALVLLFSFRILSWLMLNYLQNTVPLADFKYTFLRFFSVKTSIFAVMYKGLSDYRALEVPSMWIISTIVIILTYSLSLYFYSARKSELAERNTSGRGLQHFYSCAASLPIALFATISFLETGFNDEFGVTLVLVLTTFIVFYLCELISYKKVLASLKVTPLILIAVAFCGIFAGGATAYEKHVNGTTYQPDEIESVTFYQYDDLLTVYSPVKDSTFYWLQLPYYVENNFEIKDREVIELVSGAWCTTLENQNDSMLAPVQEHYVEIKLKNGSKLGRRIGFDEQQYTSLKEMLSKTEDYYIAITLLPGEDDVESVYPVGLPELQGEELELWELFCEEYEALTPQEKIEYSLDRMEDKAIMSSNISNSYIHRDGLLLLVHYTDILGEYFEVTEQFPRTLERFRTLLIEENQELIDRCTQLYSGSLNELLDAYGDGYALFDMRLNYQGITAQLRWNEIELDRGIAGTRDRIDLFKRLFTERTLLEYTPNQQNLLIFNLPDQESYYIPFWISGMDASLLHEIIQISDCQKMNSLFLDSSSKNCAYTWNSQPLQIAIFFPDGKQYSITANDSEEYSRLLTTMKKLFYRLDRSNQGKDSQQEDDIAIYIANGDVYYYGTFKFREIPENVMKELQPFS